MEDFSPLEDYFGLNALVMRLKSAVERKEDGDWFSQPQSYSSVARSHFPKVADMDSDTSSQKLQDFDIIKFSRVYNERANNARRRRKPLTHCVFCKNNQECERVYSSHTLKDDNGVIVCPILRAYTCPICGSSGDGAHTIKYCPANQSVGIQSRRH